MIPIPRKGTPERDRLIQEHLECVKSMAGVAGFSVLKCATPGDTTHISGGVHEDPLLKRVLLRMRGASPKGKLIVICLLYTVYTSEQDIQHAIFLMRLDEMEETDGMPEHYHEGYKRRDDNWPVT